MTAESPLLSFPPRAVRWLGDILLEIGFALVMLYWVGMAIEIGSHIISGGFDSAVAWLQQIGGSPPQVTAGPDRISALVTQLQSDRWFWIRFATGETVLIAISWGIIALRLRKTRSGR